MASINITWTSDEHDCEICGGSYAEGALVTIDGVPFGNFEAVAHCYAGVTFSQEQVYAAIIIGLGHSIVEDIQAFIGDQDD